MESQEIQGTQDQGESQVSLDNQAFLGIQEDREHQVMLSKVQNQRTETQLMNTVELLLLCLDRLLCVSSCVYQDLFVHWFVSWFANYENTMT